MESIERGGYIVAQYTENYNLELQQGTDFIDVNGLNRNFNAIDGELKNLEDDKANKDHKHKTSDITDFPTSLPADGGNANTVNGHTVNADVPSNAKFTDTVYTHPSTHPASMITGLPTSLPANGGNADTVDGFHAWQMETLSESGTGHGPGNWALKCQHNVDKDGTFKFVVGNGSMGVKVDYAVNANAANNSNNANYATSAANADKVDGLHFVVSSTVPTVNDQSIITFVI
jgi:hypothetical protein